MSNCDSRVTQNCTYITNPGYPSGELQLILGEDGNQQKLQCVFCSTGYAVQGQCQYVIKQCSRDICQVRLDYESSSLVPPDFLDNGNCNVDSFSFRHVGPANPPVFCGENAGQSIL